MGKVIYMITSVFYPSIGGVENHVYNLSKSLVNRGYVVKVINPVINLGINEIYDLNGIQVHRVSVGNKNDLNRYLKYKKTSSGSLMGYFYGYQRKNYYNKFCRVLYDYIIKDIKTEGDIQVIIHQHDFISSIKLSKKLSKEYNIIFTNHTGEFLFLKKLPFSSFIIKGLTKHFKYIIAPSNELAEFDGIRNEDTYTFLSNGVDTDIFKPIESNEISRLKEKFNIPQEKKIIFCPRRWAPTKGIIYLVKAIDILVNEKKQEDLMFVFAGNESNDYPEYVGQINKIINEKNLNKHIKLMGDIEYNSINEIMKISDMIAIPSLMEAISLAALEAMACGKIVLGTKVGGFTQIIKNGHNGFLVPPKDEAALAKAIDNICSHFESFSYVGTNAKEFINEGYSWNLISDKTSLVYEANFN